MSKRKSDEQHERGFDQEQAIMALQRLPQVLLRMAEERNKARLSAMKGNLGVVYAELKKTAELASVFIADVLGLQVEFEEQSSTRSVSRRTMMAEIAQMRELAGLNDMTDSTPETPVVEAFLNDVPGDDDPIVS